ncbi:MAG: CbiX/SirB N-terminal domain-containing protein [Lentisphaeria bacterium]|jgi:sirohydrochlorin ferrochelatase|nr:CbiX/SirB N-terminal domain-containing protein [Lentisphaeria bacterium]MDP7741432.1 CbiX/SirB N-terminal domain-containing protein [Lentisphaeria bacterium]
MPPVTALMVVDHGSRRAAANEMLVALAQRLAEHAGRRYVTVEPAHMELAEPTIGQAFDRCAAAGAERVVVSLLFLSPGRHSTSDIPGLLAAAAAAHPGIETFVTAPLGIDERLLDLLLARAAEATGD